MCLTAPGRVLAVDGQMALVDLDGVRRRASLVLLPDASVGDWVLVASGLVLEVLDEAEVDELQHLLEGATGLVQGVRS
jgi:hydrogenase expression/formation protein HypC